MIESGKELEKQKIDSVSIISEQQRKELIDGTKYHTIPYMPITKGFVQRYILNDTEYPTIESKLSQAGTEMKSRFNNIIDTSYEYEKIKVDLEEIDLDIEDIKNSDKPLSRKAIEIRRKDLEKQMKLYRMKSLEIGINDTFKEYKSWKDTVEDCLAILKENENVNGVEEVRFDLIREVEMEVKINRWKKMMLLGKELTPSQTTFIMPDLLKQADQIIDEQRKMLEEKEEQKCIQ